MYRFQESMRDLIYEDPNGKITILPPITKPKFPVISNYYMPACQSYMMACSGTTKFNTPPEKELTLTRDKYEVGDVLSTEYFIIKTPGQLPTGYDRDSPD